MKISIPILLYHQVSPAPHPNFLKYSVTTKEFHSQMEILKKLHFSPITMSDLVDYKERKRSMPRRPIIITFDDGLKDCIEYSSPILDEFGFKAVYYIPTDCVGGKSLWLQNDIGAQFQVSDWPMIKELDLNGHEIGSHSRTHPHLDTLLAEDCYKELKESKEILEDHLGHKIVHFAYPYGDFNEETKNITRDTGYLTACTTEEYIANSDHGVYSLPRLNVGMEDNLIDFVVKIYSSYTPTKILKKSRYHVINIIPKSVKNLIKKFISHKEPG